MIQIPLEIGDTILTGRFKNKKIRVKEIGTDEYGNITVNGRSILKIRIPKLYQKQENNMKLRENLHNEIGIIASDFGFKVRDFNKFLTNDEVRKRFIIGVNSNQITKTMIYQMINDPTSLGATKIKKFLQETEMNESPAKNNPKIEKIVNHINELIKLAVDSDGDPIGVIDKSGTWQEPYVYSPIEYKNGVLKITSKSQYKNTPEVEIINKKNMENDGIPTLRNIEKLYKKTIPLRGKPVQESNLKEQIDPNSLEKDKEYLYFNGNDWDCVMYKGIAFDRIHHVFKSPKHRSLTLTRKNVIRHIKLLDKTIQENNMKLKEQVDYKDDVVKVLNLKQGENYVSIMGAEPLEVQYIGRDKSQVNHVFEPTNNPHKIVLTPYDVQKYIKFKMIENRKLKEKVEPFQKDPLQVKIQKKDGKYCLYQQTINGEVKRGKDSYDTEEEAEYIALLRGFQVVDSNDKPKEQPTMNSTKLATPPKVTNGDPVKHDKPKEIDLGKEKIIKLENLIRKIINETVSWGDDGEDSLAWELKNYLYDSRHSGGSFGEIENYLKKANFNIGETELIRKLRDIDALGIKGRMYLRQFAPKDARSIKESVLSKKKVKLKEHHIDEWKKLGWQGFLHYMVELGYNLMSYAPNSIPTAGSPTIDLKRKLPIFQNDVEIQSERYDANKNIIFKTNKAYLKFWNSNLKEEINKPKLKKKIEDYIQKNWNKKPYNGQIRFKGDLLIVDNADTDFGNYASIIASDATEMKWQYVTPSIAKLQESISLKEEVDPNHKKMLLELEQLQKQLVQAKAQVEAVIKSTGLKDIEKRVDKLLKEELWDFLEELKKDEQRLVDLGNIIMTVDKFQSEYASYEYEKTLDFAMTQVNQDVQEKIFNELKATEKINKRKGSVSFTTKTESIGSSIWNSIISFLGKLLPSLKRKGQKIDNELGKLKQMINHPQK